MAAPIVKARTRFFVAAEGESERSFVTWMQRLSQEKLHIHLDCVPLGGGGFKSMLLDAVRLHRKRRQAGGPYKECFLLVDGDRAKQGNWSIEQLRREASDQRITVCVQSPNHEGLLLRRLPGMERETPDAASALTKLRNRWPNYQKPANALALSRHYSLEDLLRVARIDSDLGALVKKIGLMANP